MEHGKFLHERHKAFCVLLHYSAVRKKEGLRAVKEQFQITRSAALFSVGPRLKKSKKLKLCTCGTKNALKSKFCRQCGIDISSVTPSIIGKKSVETPPLKIPFKAAYVNILKQAIENTKPGARVFPYSDKTGYNIVRRAFKYPHLFRLSRITNFFLEGWTIAQVRSWTGLTLAALEYYVGLVDTIRMGESLARKTELTTLSTSQEVQ